MLRFSALPKRWIQGDGAGLGRIVGMACFLDQMRGDDAVDDAKHPTHDHRPSGEQET
jgi:hypothetical protein